MPQPSSDLTAIETPLDVRAADSQLDSDLAALDHPRLVLSEGYIGIDRRRPGRRNQVVRALFPLLRAGFTPGVLVIISALVLVFAGALAIRPRTAPAEAAATNPARPGWEGTAASGEPGRSVSTTTPPAQATASSGSAAVAPASTVPVSTTTVPAAEPPSASPAAPTTPAAMGAAALALVRYPYASLPDYSIRFLPSSDAPVAGFEGNTTFTWGQPGGVSTLYVYPGETVTRLAGITAFEIGHEVDASLVEPAGGHAAIENALGIHPASWAPSCDCAEQDYLSGWYAAAFSAAWSPGVGEWSALAPLPTGAVAAAVDPWLNPARP